MEDFCTHMPQGKAMKVYTARQQATSEEKAKNELLVNEMEQWVLSYGIYFFSPNEWSMNPKLKM